LQKRNFRVGVMRLGRPRPLPLSLSACGQACRCALYKLNPFVVTGSTALYDGINAHGELNRYNAVTSPKRTGRRQRNAWVQLHCVDRECYLDRCPAAGLLYNQVVLAAFVVRPVQIIGSGGGCRELVYACADFEAERY
jgi:hypothetical protein